LGINHSFISKQQGDVMPSCREFRSGEQFDAGDNYIVTIVEVRGDEVVLAISNQGQPAGTASRWHAPSAHSRTKMAIPYLMEPVSSKGAVS
jgi:hypothetical protein